MRSNTMRIRSGCDGKGKGNGFGYLPALLRSFLWGDSSDHGASPVATCLRRFAASDGCAFISACFAASRFGFGWPPVFIPAPCLRSFGAFSGGIRPTTGQAPWLHACTASRLRTASLSFLHSFAASRFRSGWSPVSLPFSALLTMTSDSSCLPRGFQPMAGL